MPVLVVLLRLAWQRYHGAMGRFAAAGVLATLVPPQVMRARAWQFVLAALVVAGMLVAAAGPRLGFDYEQRKMQGVSIQVLLDVSRSMDAADVSPSRMERARRELEDFVGLLHGDSVGLVLFAAGAWTRIPLTVDYGTFLWAVKDSDSGTIRAQGTALSGAIDLATRALEKAPASGRAILVVSDGELHEPAETLAAAVGRARDAQVRIYALGIGDAAGAPIPLPEGGFKKDASGNVVLSKLDETTLSGLASATGGAYVRAVTSDDDVRALVETEIHEKLEAAERGVRRDTVWRERFQWPLAGAFAGMVISAALGVGRRVAPLLLLLVLPLHARADTRDDGFTALAEQRWSDAARLLGQARVEDPADPAVTQGLATALYRDGRYREAEQMFDTLATATEDPGQKGISLYNAGNAAYRGGRLDDALARYQEALRQAPGLASAQKNFDAVSKELAARREPPPPKDPQGDQGNDQGDPSQGDPSQGDPSQGDPGQGDPNAGTPGQGDPAQADPGRPGDPGAPQGGDPDRPKDGTDPGQAGTPGDPASEGDPGGDPEPGEGDTDTTGAVAGGEASAGDMTAEQAGRLVDSVTEGKPRVAVGGQSTGEDW